jgi:tRNA G18 (ribose-2'-O)-methylase SpoU
MKNEETHELTFRDGSNKDVSERNVADEYRHIQDVVTLRAELAKKRHQFVNVCMNLTSDFNKGTIIRTANAFLARETWLVGNRKFNPRGTVGTHHYETIKHADDWAEARDILRADGYTLYAVDNIYGFDPVSLYEVEFPEKSAFIYGEEQAGLAEDVIRDCDAMVYIPMQGSVRSLNAASAAAIVMSEYIRQHSFTGVV